MEHGFLPPVYDLDWVVLRKGVALGHLPVQIVPGDHLKFVSVLQKRGRGGGSDRRANISVESIPGIEDVDATRNGPCSVWVVPRDHDDLHSRHARREHRFGNAGLGRVFDAKETHEAEAVESEIAIGGTRARKFRLVAGQILVVELLSGDAKDAPALPHQFLQLGVDDVVVLRIAKLQDALRGSFHDHMEALRGSIPMDRHHPLVLRIERDLKLLLVSRLGFDLRRLLQPTERHGASLENRHLSGRAAPFEFAILSVDLASGAVIEKAAQGDRLELFAERKLPSARVALDRFQCLLALLQIRYDHVLRSHFASREGACLVRA
mmetsp:Transcript_66858/g.186682  ORF Transcript_66858/g.186682 Transcript_66858/m.186682 type:complete len:322 (+) Transcript_66858:1000-1965(+)